MRATVIEGSRATRKRERLSIVEFDASIRITGVGGTSEPSGRRKEIVFPATMIDVEVSAKHGVDCVGRAPVRRDLQKRSLAPVPDG